MSLPADHFSFSQYALYCRSPAEYFKRYVVGVEEPPTLPMILGKICHQAIEKPRLKWKAELIASGFTPNYATGIEKAVAALPKTGMREKKLEAPFPKFLHDGKPVKLIGYADGYHPNLIHEWKTGRAWNQQRVDESEQLTMYALIHRLTTGDIPKFVLAHINLPNGKVTLFQTKRTVRQIEQFRKEKLEPVMQLINRGVFHRI